MKSLAVPSGRAATEDEDYEHQPQIEFSAQETNSLRKQRRGKTKTAGNNEGEALS
jgi:hypothetical protein